MKKGEGEGELISKVFSRILLVFLLTVILASTFWVGQTSSSSRVIWVPDDYPTIQEAINAANPGDIILVREGYYKEGVIVITKSNLSIIAAPSPGKNVTVDGMQRGVVFDIYANNVTVQNFIITNSSEYGSGLWCLGNYCRLWRNLITACYFGIESSGGDFNDISYNIIEHCGVGLLSWSGSKCNKIFNNTINDNDYGIILDGCYGGGYNQLRGNQLMNNNFSFGVQGLYPRDFINDVDESNIVDGKPICYLINVTNVQVTTPNYACIIVVNSSNVTIANQSVARNYDGILLAYSTNCTLKNVTSVMNRYGISLKYSSNNLIHESQIYNNYEGIYFEQAEENMLYSNFVINNNIGIDLHCSNRNTLLGNSISNNSLVGISILKFIGAQTASNNLIVGNAIKNNQNGIALLFATYNKVFNNLISGAQTGLHMMRAHGNIIFGNIICENQYGISIRNSNSNIIYHNDFFRNGINVPTPFGSNVWDGGYPFGGNFWSDYNGTDANGDGIGDSPYVIDSYNVDRYPLMYPCNPHDVSVLGIDCPEPVFLSQPVNVSVYVKNEGVWTERFTLKLYSEFDGVRSMIGSENLTLRAGEKAIISFKWMPALVPITGSCTLIAEASEVPAEYDLKDNRATRQVSVIIPQTIGGATNFNLKLMK